MNAESQKPDQPARPACPECGAEIKPQDRQCWLCHRLLVIDAEVVESGSPFAEQVAPPKWVNPAQFSLETLMLVITLVAVCLGMIMALPGLGIVVAIVAAPALVRTLVAGYQERKAGTPMTLGEKLLTFAASTGVAVAVLVTGGTAFAAACVGSCFVALGVSQSGSGTGWNQTFEQVVIPGLLIFSATIGLATAGWLFWVLRPRRAK
jgi:hypothetical protein